MSQIASQESGAQLLARISSVCRPNIYCLDGNIFPDNGPNRRDIVEISGDEGIGKTTLLMHIMARVILPVNYGGKDGMVVFLLTDYNFDMDKFKCVLKSIIYDVSSTENNVDDIVAISLRNITIQRCFDELQFDLAIHGLDEILSSNDRYSLLALDSVGAFCWTFHIKSYMNELLHRLKRVLGEYHLVLVYTKPAYFLRKNRSSEGKEGMDYKIELICKDSEAMDPCLVFKVNIPNYSQSIYRNYEFDDSNGLIVFR